MTDPIKQSPLTTAEVATALQAVRELLTPAIKWIQEEWFKMIFEPHPSEEGEVLPIQCFCLGGVLAFVASEGRTILPEDLAKSYIPLAMAMGEAMGFSSDNVWCTCCASSPFSNLIDAIIEWNDYVHRTHAEVIARIDNAIEALNPIEVQA